MKKKRIERHLQGSWEQRRISHPSSPLFLDSNFYLCTHVPMVLRLSVALNPSICLLICVAQLQGCVASFHASKRCCLGSRSFVSISLDLCRYFLSNTAIIVSLVRLDLYCTGAVHRRPDFYMHSLQGGYLLCYRLWTHKQWS